MQVKIDLKIIIFVLFFYAIGRYELLYILLLICVVIHELAHTLVGILLNREIQCFTIMPIGAYISFKTDVNSYNKKIINGSENNLKKLIIALAGPIINIIFAIVFSFKEEYILITYINMILAIFNLLPIYPMDGGRIVKEILTILYGRRKALKYSNIVSNISLIITSIIVIMFCLITKSILLAISIIYLIYIRKKEIDRYNLIERMYKILEEKVI